MFEREDLQRVRLAAGPDPMWEMVLSLHRARDAAQPARLADWRRRVRRDAPRTPENQAALANLFTLVPVTGRFPDFLTPAPLTTDWEAGCEAIASLSGRRLRTDLALAFAHREPPPWVRRLASGDRGSVQALSGAVQKAYDLLVAPQWPAVGTTVAHDRGERVRLLTERGVGAMLASLPGILGWDGRVLLTRFPESHTIHLQGRGLTVVPSYFCSGNPITFIDADLPPVLIYAAGDARRGSATAPPEHLAAVVGRTRAACLHSLQHPATTTELAGRLGISIGTASKQAALLRQAGLIASMRNGNAIQHALTGLGHALLHQD
ncbi:winged helix-turn-helix domain-containing protein [Fodinicola acaciae]|uniref:winged helix-turn-helix domain-containing protein n=1 Tax=Fodinicola acaciae TaxID=2681555 RepID=UPI0013D1B1DD|nr:winged helix-turn-helix domain-containing protein [Fodinicola acaciae]